MDQLGFVRVGRITGGMASGKAVETVNFSDWIIPILLAGTAIYALFRKEDVFDALRIGAADGLTVVWRIAPSLVALLSVVTMFRASGALEWLTNAVTPILCRLGVPPETVSILLVRPLSGSGALAAASELMDTYGVDSKIGRTAAVMMGCTETTFYTIAVYFGAAEIKRTRYTVFAALTADLVGFVAAAWCVDWWFG